MTANPYESGKTAADITRWPRRWAMALSLSLISGVTIGGVGGYIVGHMHGAKDGEDALLDMSHELIRTKNELIRVRSQ